MASIPHVIRVFRYRFLQTISRRISRTFGQLIYFVWEASIIRVSQTFTTHCQIKCSHRIPPVNKHLKFLYLIKMKLLCISFIDNIQYVLLSRRCIILVLQSWLFMCLITIDTNHVICSVHVLLHISFIPVSPVFLPFMEFECSFYCCQAEPRNKNTPLPLLW